MNVSAKNHPPTDTRPRRGCLALLAVLALTFALSTSAHADTQSLLDRTIELKMGQARVPGLAACIVKEDRIAWAGGYGWAHIENQVPVTPDTLFMLASEDRALMEIVDLLFLIAGGV